ncbi:hypothetical protein NUACC26_096410 [Scytonema sp. NUACC26]
MYKLKLCTKVLLILVQSYHNYMSLKRKTCKGLPNKKIYNFLLWCPEQRPFGVRPNSLRRRFANGFASRLGVGNPPTARLLTSRCEFGKPSGERWLTVRGLPPVEATAERPARHQYRTGEDARTTRWIIYFLDIPKRFS